MRRPSVSRSISKFIALLGLVVTATGCANFGYLVQAGKGQFALWNEARPVDEWLKSETLSPRIKELLRKVPEIKAFGEGFGIRATGNYRSYVNLDRDALVYAVSACESLEFRTRKWDFPILGSVPYLGFFHREDALHYADELRAEARREAERKGLEPTFGLIDVDVRNVPAYSTLGWFPDPLVSSMIPEGDDALGELAETVLHESLHATLYIPHQSSFNESLATFVGQSLADRYLREHYGEEAAPTRAYRLGNARSKEVSAAFASTAAELKTLYASEKSRADKLTAKEKILTALRERYRLRRPPNNASLSQYLTYSEGTAPFRNFFESKCASDWRRFLASVSRLKPDSFPEPQTENIEPVLRTLDCPPLST